MKVFVVMGNDFPDSVWDTEEAAEKYCEAQRNDKNYSPRIYWRVYEFTVRK